MDFAFPTFVVGDVAISLIIICRMNACMIRVIWSICFFFIFLLSSLKNWWYSTFKMGLVCLILDCFPHEMDLITTQQE